LPSRCIARYLSRSTPQSAGEVELKTNKTASPTTLLGPKLVRGMIAQRWTTHAATSTAERLHRTGIVRETTCVEKIMRVLRQLLPSPVC
jgi:hypothetical protein